MTQTKVFRVYNQFSKGLITEASPLNFPADTTYDENNMFLSKKGNRTRRYGINYSSSVTTGIARSGFTSNAINEFRWLAANNDSTANFICLQIGTNLYLYNFTLSTSATINLLTYKISGAADSDVQGQQVSFCSGNGFLFVAGKYTDPIVVSWNGSSFTATKLFILIRDFIGLDDSLGPDAQPAALTKEHHYNLYNQGWASTSGGGNTVTYWTSFGAQSTYAQGGDGLINDYHTNESAYPGNNKLWWWGVDSNNGLSSNKLVNIAAGNIRAPKGHYVVNAFNVDRTAVSGVAALTAVTIPERPSTNAYFAGRIWYGCQETVYFSRVLDYNTYYNANFCCQEADPTSQMISDLIATDGGTILIPGIGRIIRLYPVGSGMLVLGSNGVKFIQGGSGGFSATDFAVSQMSPIGMDAPGSVAEVDSNIFWMSYVGIQGMSYKNGIFGPIQGNFDKLNISLDTIQTFYTTNLPASVRANVKAVYDPSTNVIQWLYRSGDITGNYYYDSVLNLDLYLQAFYPWKFTTPGSTGPFVIGAIQGLTAVNTTVGSTTRPSQILYLTVVPNSSDFNLAISQTNYTSFADWYTLDSVGKAYPSYMESGFDILQDATRKKWLPWLYCYFRRTEQNLTTADSGVTYVADRPSSCMLTVKWDFADSTVSNKWTTPVQAYRMSRIPFIDGSGSLALDTGFYTVVTKNKIRGNGTSIQFRFESNLIGYDFDLLGWATEFSGNITP